MGESTHASMGRSTDLCEIIHLLCYRYKELEEVKMAELSSILAVLGLFILRIGLPVVALITLGILVDRWQSHRDAEVRNMYAVGQIEEEAPEEAQDDVKKRKTA
jgi:hypothetical protein